MLSVLGPRATCCLQGPPQLHLPGPAASACGLATLGYSRPFYFLSSRLSGPSILVPIHAPGRCRRHLLPSVPPHRELLLLKCPHALHSNFTPTRVICLLLI